MAILPQHKHNGRELLTALQTHDVGFFVHVACPWLEGVTCHLGTGTSLATFATPSPDHALATAAGAWLGGKTVCVLLPSTSLMGAASALQGVLQMHGVPCVLIISWRGEGGAKGVIGAGAARPPDAPETHRAGETLLPWLDVCNVRRRVLKHEDLAE